MKAFPLMIGENVEPSYGMDLRDWFAGMALHGVIETIFRYQQDYDHIAHHAYKIADAMMKAREEQNNG